MQFAATVDTAGVQQGAANLRFWVAQRFQRCDKSDSHEEFPATTTPLPIIQPAESISPLPSSVQ
jgi:hypothetical protein